MMRLAVLLLSVGAMLNGGYWELRHRLVWGATVAVTGIIGVVVASGAVGGPADG